MTTQALAIPPQVSAFLDRDHHLLIDGDWVESVDGERADAVDPGTGRVLGSFEMAGARDVDRAVDAAAAAFDDGAWSILTAAERSRLLHRLADLLEENKEELAILEALDTGKPLAVARDFDVEYSIRHLRYFAGWPTKIEGATIPVAVPDMMCRTERVPAGVAALIVPWNYPLLIACWKLAPALAAGCTAILKPAEQSSLTALRLADLTLEAGFPPGVVNVLPGRGERIGPVLVEHPRVDKISFTGSTAVGKEIATRAAGAVKRVTLELGGKSANIVLADANLDHAVAGAAAAIFSNAGQMCSAGSRLFVERPIFDEFLDRVAEVAAKIRVGHQLEPDTDMGPLISPEQLTRVTGYVDAARADGATLHAGGEVNPPGCDPDGAYLMPTVISGLPDESAVVREEIFGPVVVALPFDDLDEVARRANASIYGLAAGVWTRDIAKANVLSNRLRVGSVYVNTYGQSDAAAPFGGFKMSGYGRDMGRENLESYLETRTVWTDLRV